MTQVNFKLLFFIAIVKLRGSKQLNIEIKYQVIIGKLENNLCNFSKFIVKGQKEKKKDERNKQRHKLTVKKKERNRERKYERN